MKSGSFSSEEGRRRAGSAVAALQSSHRATALLVRRWAAEGGSEGRYRRKPIAIDLRPSV